MKRNTRQEILEKAKELFNERGFNAVSTGDIAGALGISKGNLTYYFKKKEEIIEAILLECQKVKMPEAPENLAELNDFILDIQCVVKDNAFYFWHHAQLSQLSPNIRQRQSSVYQGNVRKLAHCFGVLKKDGYLREEIFTGQYDRMIDAVLLSGIYWMPFCDLKQQSAEKDTVQISGSVSFQHHAWSILYPLLTEKGRAELQEIIQINK